MAVYIDESIFMGQDRVRLAHKGRPHYDTVRDEIMSNPCVSLHTIAVNVDVVHFSREMIDNQLAVFQAEVGLM